MNLLPARSLVLCIDIQDRFQAAIPDIAADRALGRRAGQLLAGATLLGVPRLISEQVPDKLGATLPHLRAAAGDAPVLAKRHFSCVEDPGIRAHLDRHADATVVIAGIEAHICVLATVADLRALGRPVVLCADAVGSRDPEHRQLALAAARDLGAQVLPVETVLFRWQRIAGEGHFKAISALVR
jgi:nicotinamidase-related amidase